MGKAKDEEYVSRTMTPAEHIAQAERDARTMRLAYLLATEMGGCTSLDVQFCDMLLHMSEVHLKLAEAKGRTEIVTVDDATLEQRLGG